MHLLQRLVVITGIIDNGNKEAISVKKRFSSSQSQVIHFKTYATGASQL